MIIGDKNMIKRELGVMCIVVSIILVVVGMTYAWYDYTSNDYQNKDVAIKSRN